MSAAFDDDEDQQLEACERRIDYRFFERGILRAAMTHASGAHHRLGSNERLEFLGDAVLGAVVCEMLFHQFPHSLEGDLTKIKSVVVSRMTCAKISDELGLEEFLVVGKGMTSVKSVPRSVLADVFESIVAAIYLDGGMEPVRDFIHRWMQPEIDRVAAADGDDNYKSLLQQKSQRDFGETPTYDLLDERGPDHEKSFKVRASIGSRGFPPAWGRNKKEAEQRAACNALAALDGDDIPFQ